MFPARDPERSARLMHAIDSINGRFGSGTVRPAIAGMVRRWAAKSEFLSPRYTTRLDELLIVHA
jgi:DNA polymerase V